MLSKILSKNDCANCRFCCSFRRQSLWETPIFEWRPPLDLAPLYKTQNPDEEVPCPYLDAKTGCTLSDEKKPFDCKIWPLRVVKAEPSEPPALAALASEPPQKNCLKIVLTPTCKAINKLPLETVKNFVNSGPGEQILAYAKAHPQIIKDDSDFFIDLS